MKLLMHDQTGFSSSLTTVPQRLRFAEHASARYNTNSNSLISDVISTDLHYNVRCLASAASTFVREERGLFS